MKTASIRVYQPFGTSEWVADVLYRGQVLKSFDRRDTLEYLPCGVILSSCAMSMQSHVGLLTLSLFNRAYSAL